MSNVKLITGNLTTQKIISTWVEYTFKQSRLNIRSPQRRRYICKCPRPPPTWLQQFKCFVFLFSSAKGWAAPGPPLTSWKPRGDTYYWMSQGEWNSSRVKHGSQHFAVRNKLWIFTSDCAGDKIVMLMAPFYPKWRRKQQMMAWIGKRRTNTVNCLCAFQ